ncbi:hypothetical protein PHYSODRAFT_341061 [Phytophthora sojae]|uniref:WW domain-containing protein n=1 Tax=Phytophthora sojae (strain P6497) TaxID=1094619 RepID=G5AC09_PHYSP|nr:hypothetical protein PHYSODRAFT_341061 [Phytophthora sojae]EGZ06884.1 hypothetical protein PHYSODRAFT_341061 [Phytophthora sojae]|eukprot:XP_009537648.1 hypothetical protein PHYSODRAFT_341061 [Phytophthora sojae]
MGRLLGASDLPPETKVAVALFLVDLAARGTGASAATVAESATGAKILAKTHELADKIAAGATIVDSAMRDEESILQEQLAKQQHEEAEEAEREQTRLRQEEEEADRPERAAAERVDRAMGRGAGKLSYVNKQTDMSSWEKPRRILAMKYY